MSDCGKLNESDNRSILIVARVQMADEGVHMKYDFRYYFTRRCIWVLGVYCLCIASHTTNKFFEKGGESVNEKNQLLRIVYPIHPICKTKSI